MNNNPTGINQYSGGGKGGKLISYKSLKQGKHVVSTRDQLASGIKKARSIIKSKGVANAPKTAAQLKAFRTAGKGSNTQYRGKGTIFG